MNCSDGLAIDLLPATGNALASGQVVIAIETGGGKTGFRCTIGADEAHSGCEPTGGESVLDFVSAHVTVSQELRKISVVFSGSTPASVTVTVERDGTTRGPKTFTPRYRTVEPNGHECGPTCHGAIESWAVL